MKKSIVQEDNDFIFSKEETAIRALIDSHLLITGATGFVGLSMLLPLLEAHVRLSGKGRVTIISRSKQALYRKYPHLYSLDCLQVLESDIRDIRLAGIATPDFVMHAATSSSVPQSELQEKDLHNVILNGQIQFLSELSHYPKFRMLFTSSGAVYRTAAAPLETPYEETLTPILEVVDSYGTAKLMAEQILMRESASGRFDITCARLFAFVGPYLPLDKHFAIGNFIGHALRNEEIVITGDGKTVRSYQYSADLACWLINLLVTTTGQEIVNIGSDESVSISTLAQKISKLSIPNTPIQIKGSLKTPSGIDYYVPDINKASRIFKLTNRYSLQQSISRTLVHHQEAVRL